MHLISGSVAPMAPVNVPLSDACGYTLAFDVVAPTDIPAFDQSAMDGYAIRFDDRTNRLQVLAEVPAGSAAGAALLPGNAVRIFTGAPVPPGADTVVMQEKVKAGGGTISVLDVNLEKGKNIRSRGSEIKTGQLALSRGSVLSPAGIGFLAGIGISEVSIHPPPGVTLVVTGSELTDPGTLLEQGQVYESNSYALRAALQRCGVTEIRTIRVKDDAALLTSSLGEALQSSSMILLTGGVSVGDYDFVTRAAAACGVTQVFHKVKQKPGKPMYFGVKDIIPVFGLPGNPASVLTCFYEYVAPAIARMLGRKIIAHHGVAKLQQPYHKAGGLTHFLKGSHCDGKVWILPAQESYRMRSFAEANCLVVIPEAAEAVGAGDDVEVRYFKYE